MHEFTCNGVGYFYIFLSCSATFTKESEPWTPLLASLEKYLRCDIDIKML